MKKTYKLEDLDCAVCAAKMEEAVRALEGVTAVSVSFLGQKLSIEAADDRFEQIMDQVVKTCKRIEPDCVICR